MNPADQGYETIRVRVATKRRLLDEKDRIRRLGAKAPSVSALIDQAMDDYVAKRLNVQQIGGTATPFSMYPSRHREAHKLLETILESGDRKAIDWILGNLKMFSEALQGRVKSETSPSNRETGEGGEGPK